MIAHTLSHCSSDFVVIMVDLLNVVESLHLFKLQSVSKTHIHTHTQIFTFGFQILVSGRNLGGREGRETFWETGIIHHRHQQYHHQGHL